MKIIKSCFWKISYFFIFKNKKLIYIFWFSKVFFENNKQTGVTFFFSFLEWEEDLKMTKRRKSETEQRCLWRKNDERGGH